MSKRELKQAENVQKAQGKKGGRGTHGSLTKSGKVRSQTPKVEKTSLKKKKGPSVQNRKEHYLFTKKSRETSEKKRERM